MANEIDWSQFQPEQPVVASVAQDVDWSQFQPAPEKPGLIRSLADTALEIPMGANAATKAIIDAFGAGSGPSNWLDSTVKNYQAMQSPYRQFERGVQAQRSQDAEASGSAWNEVGASFQNFAEAPISAMANAAGSIVPTAIGMAAAAPAGMATGAAAGMGALMGAGAVKGSIYDDLIARGKGAGLSDVEAKTQADAAQAYFGPNMDQIGIGTILGVLAGSTGVEKVLGVAPSTVRNLAARTLLGAGQEAVPEAAQGGQEKLAANLAAQRAGYQADTWSGVAGQATAEGLASTGPGGVAGAMAKYEAATGPISRAAAIAEAQQAQAIGALPAPGQLSGQAAMAMGQGGDVGDPAAVLAAQRQNTELQAARQAEEQRRAQFDLGYADRLNGTRPVAPVATDGQGAATDAQATDAQPQDRQRTRYAGPEPLIGVDPAQPQQLAMPGPIADPAVQLDVKRTTTQDQYLSAQRKRANGQLLSQQETVLLNGPNPFADGEGRIITQQPPAGPRPAQGEAAVQEVLQVEDNLAYMRAGPNDEVLDRTPKPGKAPDYFTPIAQKNGRVAVSTPSTEGVATLARQLGGVPNKAAGGFTFRDSRVANRFVKAAEAEGFVMTPAARKAKVASTQQAAETVASANGDRVEDVSIYTAQNLPDAAARGERGSRLSRAQASVIEGMGRIFGTQYRFYDSPNSAKQGDGFVLRSDGGRTAFVRAVEGDAAPLVVAGHETYHGLSKAERARFSAAINPYVDASDDAQLAFLSDYTTGKYKDKILKLHASGVTSGEILDAIIAQAKQDGTAKLDRAALREEFDADIFGNRLKETGLWEKVFAAMAQQDRSLLVKLRDSIKQIIDYLKSQKGQLRGFDTDRYVKDLEAVQQIAARAILSSANRQQKSEQASPSAGNVVRSTARVGPYRSKSTADLTATLKGGTVVQVGDEFFVEQGNGQGLDQGRSDRAKVDAGTGRRGDPQNAAEPRAARGDQPQARPGRATSDIESQVRRSAQGAVSLTGVHFSREPRQVLDGRFYGTGLKGAEARRLIGEPDRRLHERVYAYVNEGAGITAESGVGGYPHALELSNLYDLAADPLDLRTDSFGDTNALEAAILDRGFDGYYSKGAFPALKQGAAVVLGDASHAIVPAGEAVRSPRRTLPTFEDGVLPSRWPTSVKSEAQISEVLVPNLDALRLDQKQFENNVALLVAEPGMHSPDMQGATADEQAEHVISRLVDNLVALHDMVPAEIRARAKLWYDRGNEIAARWSERFGLTRPQVAGMLAVLSPQKDWYMNVTLAERVADILTNQMGHRYDRRMDGAAFNFLSAEYLKPEEKRKGQNARLAVKGKTLESVVANGNPVEIGFWVRTYDEAYFAPQHAVVTPEGGFAAPKTSANGDETVRAWGSFDTIGKAASVFLDGSPENIHRQIGGEHKVRNFYNNINTPQDPRFVTIDTHAVAAALWRPLSGNDIAVGHNFGTGKGVSNSAVTGVNGTYPIYLEAYTRAAKKRKILPREMQSITWEAVRGLFTAGFKGKKANVQAIEDIWHEVDAGKLSIKRARAAILERAGGMLEPTWWSDDAALDQTLADMTYSRNKPEFEGAKLTFEVAPDPRDAALKEAWDALPAKQQDDISYLVAWEIGAKTLASFEDPNMKGELHAQLGGWLDDTNPSLSIQFNKRASGSKITDAVRVLGYALRQMGMMRTSPKKFEGASRYDAIYIGIPQDASLEKIETIYGTIRDKVRDASGEPVVFGHTTVPGLMVILNDGSIMGGEALSLKIDDALNGAFDVWHADTYAAFPELGDNEYGLSGQASSPTEQSLRARAGNLRQEADSLFQRLVEGAGTEARTDEGQGSGEVVRSSRRGSTLSELTVRNEIKDAIQAWEGPGMPGKTDKMSIARQLRALKSALAADNMSLDDKHLLAYNSLAEASRINPPSGQLSTDNSASPVTTALLRLSPEAAARDLATRLLAADGRYPVGGLVLDVATGAKTPQVSIESATGGFFGTVFDPTTDSLAASLEEFIPDRMSVKEVRAFLEGGVARSARRAAPNGLPSKLTEQQWHQVRTPAFKKWFGDWEKFANTQGGVWADGKGVVSKVVDRETGEPLVVYHGSTEAGFPVFEGARNPRGTAATFFTSHRPIAQSYSGRRAPETVIDEEGRAPGIYSVFLNIRNPHEAYFEGANWDGSREGQYQVVDENGDPLYAEDGTGYFADRYAAEALAEENPGSEVVAADEFWASTNSVVEEAARLKADGAIMWDVVDNGSQADVWESSDVFAVFKPTQIKSAVANQGTFDAASDDIRRSGRRAAPDTQAFRDWFGNSKMVDRNGAPVTFMHGSPNAFEAFSDEALGTGSSHASAGLGHFFTTSTSLAEKYADGGNLYRGWLRIEKPYRMPLEEAQSFDTVAEAKARRAALQAQGYDGIVILDDMRKPWATVAFAPWQFKSENNVGTFDEFDDRFARSARRDPAYADITPEQDAALRAVGLIREPKTAKQRFAELTDGLSKRLVQGVVDQYAPLKDLDFRSYVLARMSKGSDGTLEAAMYYGTPRVAGDTIEIDTSTGGFLKMMSQLNGEQDRFLSWIAANRAEQLTAEGREFLFTPQQIADLKGLNQGTMKDGTDRTQRYARVLGEFNAFQDAVLAIAEDRGLIDQASRTVWQNGFYVPFYRNMEDGTTGPSVKSGLVNQYAFKKLKGSSRQLNEDLLANTLQNMAHLLGAASKNQAARASLVAAQSAGVAHRVPAGTKGSVRFLDGGREQHFIIDDPFIYDAITSLESVKVVGLEKVLSKFKHWLTLGVTINPAFQLRSLLRDMIASMAVSDIEKNPLTNVSTGIRSQLVKDQDYINALASGGLIRFNSLMEGNRADHTRKLIKMGVADQTILDTPEKVKHFFTKALDKYLAVGDISESTNRMALYKQQIAKGTDPLLAAYMSRDLMDFSMQGQWRAVRFLTQVVPFLNARLQGLYKLGRDGVVPVARVLVGGGNATDKQIAKRFGAVTGAVAMASILLLSAYKDDEDWKKREDWDRDTYWWFKLGDTAYRIPKPFEVGAIGTIAERGFEMLVSDEMTGKRFGERMGHMMSSTFALNPIPQAVKPLLDVYSNEDSFTQRPIETMGMERLKPEDRFTGNTSEVAKWLGKLGLPEPGRLMAGQIQPLSPVQIDALIKGYFSWLGVSASRVVDESVRVVADRPERPAMQLRDVFFAGNFVEGLPANASRYVTALYDQAKGIEEAYASYRFALRQGNRERAMELMDLEGDKIRMQPMVAKGKQALSKLNESIRAIERDPGMSALEKRDRIDRIKAMQNTIAMRVSAALR